MTDDKAMHLFIRGEIRTDGWKSQWRKDLETLRKMVKALPVFSVPTPKPKPVSFDKLAYQRNRYKDLKAKGICIDCGSFPARAKRNTCASCQVKRNAAQLRRYYANKG